jgi:hypothetical protein
MRRVARRLDGHGAAVQLRREDAFGLKFVEHSVEERGIAGVEAQFVTEVRKAAALAQRCQCVTRRQIWRWAGSGHPGGAVSFWHNLLSLFRKS